MKVFAVAVLALSMAGAGLGHSEEMKPLAAQSISLGSVTGVAYYTTDLDGYHVVATFADGASGLPLRLAATLDDGQSVRVSVPGGVGEAEHEIEIAREGASVFVRPPATAVAGAVQ